MEVGIVIEGLSEFRRALREAQGRAPRELTAGLKRAGQPILSRASATAPHRTGALAGSFTTSVRGTRADIVSRIPYAAGAEWGRNGRWRGFDRYGSPPRFVWPAVEGEATNVMNIIAKELDQVITIMGWAQ